MESRPSSTAVATSGTFAAREPCVAPDRTFHVTLLALSAGVVFLSAVLQVVGERQVVIPVIELPLPGVCTSLKWFHIECPGCGLTRSFVSLGHGDLAAAWRFNPAGPLGFLLVVVQLPYRSAQLLRMRGGRPELRWGWIGQLLLGAFLCLLVGQWSVRLLIG